MTVKTSSVKPVVGLFGGHHSQANSSAIMAELAVSAPAKRGRKPSSFWPSFTEATDPYKLRAAVCRHCQELVRHHRKSEQARSHLMKCAAFLRSVEASPTHEQPEWFVSELQKRRRKAETHSHRELEGAAEEAAAGAVHVFQLLGAASGTSSLFVSNARAKPKTTPDTGFKKATTVKLQKKEIKQVEDALSMHFFLNMTDDALGADPWRDYWYLVNAVSTAAGGAPICLPDEKRLTSVVLDRCYAALKRRVSKFLASLPSSVALTLDESPCSTPDELVMNYFAVPWAGKSLLMESVIFPDSSEHSQAEWTANDLLRIVGSLPVDVAGCVSASLSPQHCRSWDIFEANHPTLFFHGCLRTALEQLLADIFAGSEDPSSSLTLELQQFAMQCHDLTSFLHRNVEVSTGYGDGSERGLLHIFDATSKVLDAVAFQPGATRVLSVKQAVVGILRAEIFLDPSSVAQLSATMGAKTFRHASTHAFRTQLQKSLHIISPIARFVARFSGVIHGQPISEVFQNFQQLSNYFSESAQLDDQEKMLLHALVGKQQNIIIRRAHLLANLLDPIHGGQDLGDDVKAQTEAMLLSFPAADGFPRTDEAKEALYLQYTDYQIVSLQLRSGHGDPFVLRMLKERKKSPLQYWLTDGGRWPTLQHIACRVHSMPPCAVVSSHVLQRPNFSLQRLRPRLNSLAVEKIAFLRANARALGPPGSGASSATSTAAVAAAIKFLDESADPSADTLVFESGVI